MTRLENFLLNDFDEEVEKMRLSVLGVVY